MGDIVNVRKVGEIMERIESGGILWEEEWFVCLCELMGFGEKVVGDRISNGGNGRGIMGGGDEFVKGEEVRRVRDRC